MRKSSVTSAVISAIYVTLQNDGCLLAGKHTRRSWPGWEDDRDPAGRIGPFQEADNENLALNILTYTEKFKYYS
jgi:hypothetical protein